jgi:hypothetical protein
LERSYIHADLVRRALAQFPELADEFDDFALTSASSSCAPSSGSGPAPSDATTDVGRRRYPDDQSCTKG